MAPVVDPTQRAAGDDKDWVNEPLKERHNDMIIHTEKPFNAEPPYYALRDMITPPTLHYRRQHTPVPVVDEDAYRVSIGLEGKELKKFSLKELKQNYKEEEIAVTLMCSGNRRSEFNTEKEGETMGLPWKNGSISTARWSGCSLAEVLKSAGISPDCDDDGYHFLTMYGIEDYHVSVPIRKVFNKGGDCKLVWKMNGLPLPRDHGYPLRVMIPGFVGARSVKWIDRIVVTKKECDGMHQTGIAYKQLGPNKKSLGAVSKQYIESMPPIDSVPVLSAITAPERGATVRPGADLNMQGYAYSGVGQAIIRVDVSIDGGETWDQAEMERADETQGIRSGRAWAWVQWRYKVKVPENAKEVKLVCKAVDDQYNQQPHSSVEIWNLRGILNTAWGTCDLKVNADGLEITEEARSGDGTIINVGIKTNGTFQCPECRQKFESDAARKLHWKFIHDPNRHQED